ncbi:undecaprenyl-diphosphatase [Ferroacidibacillus organovorans]|uniref:Phosphoesterase n=1 Tax=Ferroacidibacillus organovorans TaxID=1765683 RepID=A0A101XNT3_9BACL|nr:undecaprenyl-diphosphatase [Ferroacidibacillus organovorans]KUO94676.1 phosphoesterase [Ferroacidibacillus organovorans]
MNPFDVTVFHAVNNIAGHQPVLDAVMIFFATGAPYLYGALFIIGWFVLPKADRDRRHGLVVSALSGVLALVINVLIGHAFYRPRPFVALPQGTFHQLIPHVADSSFPSDHAAGSFGFAFGVQKYGPRIYRYLFMVVAIIVSIARVYVGVHWPTDVIAGFFVGLISSLVIRRFEKYVRPLTDWMMRLFRMGGTFHSAGDYGTRQ